jgi:outer membrane immunogenic protein
MRRLSLAVIAATSTVVAFAQIASAADLPRKAPPPAPPPPVYSWTGFYVGLNAGGAWGNSDHNSIFSCPAGTGNTDCTYSFPANVAAASAAATGSVHANGFTGGVQAGYNWQAGVWIFGVEADFNAFNLSGSRAAAGPFPQASSNFAVGSSVDTDWLFTARGRLGGLITPAVLLYVTGGLAVTKLEIANTFTDDFTPRTFGSSSQSDTKAGWTVGAGVEWMFAPRWSAKAEYLYVDFGSVSTTLVTNNAFALNSANLMTTSVDLKAHIARAGINYHF